MAATTNGASLEDCHTNIFSLIDLNGIRWKTFRPKDSNNFIYTPVDTHPILSTYAKCIQQNHIAVWRHEPQKSQLKQQQHHHSHSHHPAHHPNHPSHMRHSSTSTTPTNPTLNARNQNDSSTPTSSTNAASNNNYELWIFGYGNQLKLDNVIDDDLVEIEDESWDSKGLSYECRSLLFKALHNLVEHCFLDKGFVRLGRWFVHPSPDTAYYSSVCHHQLSSTNVSGSPPASKFARSDATNSIKGFSSSNQNKVPIHHHHHIHQNQHQNNLSATISSTINRLIDCRNETYQPGQSNLNGLRHTSLRSTSSTYFTTSIDGTRSSLSFSFSFFVHGDCTICCIVDVRQHPLIYSLTKNDMTSFQEGGIVRVALAPYGLNGVLNGVSHKDSDNETATSNFIQQWTKFYPLPKTVARQEINNNGNNQKQQQQLSGRAIIPSKQSSGQNTEHSSSRSYLSNLTNMLSTGSNQKQQLYLNQEPDEVPIVVEVIVAGVRMRYPSECVFTTTKVVDPYICLNNAQNNSIKTPNTTPSRKSIKNNQSKSSKLSILSEKLTNEDKSSDIDGQNNKAKIKIEPLDDGVKQKSTYLEYSNKTFGNNASQQQDGKYKPVFNPGSNNKLNDKNVNGSSEYDLNNLSSNQITPMTTTTSSTTGVTSVKYGSMKLNSNSNTVLASTDLVKLLTPPSLEQIVLSPSTITDETTIIKQSSILSPLTLNQINNNQLTDSNSKEENVSVYKPAVCAFMTPSPKWAPLPHISVSSAKSLPPDCIYKPETKSKQQNNFVNVKSGSKNHHSANNQTSLSLLSSSKTSSGFNSPSVPLADQTNKTAVLNHHLKLGSPHTNKSLITNNNSLLAASQHTPSSAAGPPSASSLLGCLSSANPIMKPALSSTFSPFTLPHQRLFNNLNEVNAIQLNLLLSDSAFGMFKDHNFESCTLCVCNMSIKGSIAADTLPVRAADDPNSIWKQPFGLNENVLSLQGSVEYTNECTCGFSAITNRHFSHLSGLFFEDELEITNVLYDPTEMIDQHKTFKKFRLSAYTESAMSEDNKRLQMRINEVQTSSKPMADDMKQTKDFDSKSHFSSIMGGNDRLSSHPLANNNNNSIIEETKIFVIDQLKQLCSTTIHTNSSLSKLLLVESFRNNRHLTSCTNYYAQSSAPSSSTSSSALFDRFLDDRNKKYLTVKMLNRNPTSLKFSDFCELTKNIISKLHTQSAFPSRLPNSNSLSRSLGVTTSGGQTGNAPSSISVFSSGSVFSRLLNQASAGSSHAVIGNGKLSDNPHRNLFLRGLQALVSPTLSADPKGALQLLEQLKQDDSKLTLALINRAIVIFSSPIHDWQFLSVPIPENNFDVANLLKFIQPMLDKSIGSHNKLYKDYLHEQQQHIFSSRDSPTGAPVLPTPPCQGPLTWRQFHQAAGRGSEDQCEPQPIPSILIGHHVERNHLAVSPFALKFWDKLLLEPYAPCHNIFHLVVTPDHPSIMNHVNSFFKELGNTYELLKLGKHVPISTGFVKVPLNDNSPTETSDSWFSSIKLDSSYDGYVNKLKKFSAQFNASLVKTIVDFFDERQPPYDPHLDRFTSSPNPTHSNRQQIYKTAPTSTATINKKPFDQPQQHHQSQQQQQSSFNMSNNNIIPATATPIDQQQSISGNTSKSQTLTNSSTVAAGSTNAIEEGIYLEEEASKQTGLVIYVVDPFSAPAIKQNLRVLASIGLFRCYSQLLELLPENLRRITQLQLVSLDSIITHSRPIIDISKANQLKSLSLNVYSRCRRILSNQATAKSLTGFGPAAALENFFKTKNPELCATRMFAPPYILAPMKDKQTELGEMFGDRRERSSVLFCSYCITEDQKWLLASVTNDKGEISETTVININIEDRLERPKASVKRLVLRKLMEFVLSVMSDWQNPWRLVMGKLGRVGHGELREWGSIFSKRSLLNYSRNLTERCRQCSILPSMETVSILSACLVSLEPDSKMRIMPDQFANDDRNASFNKCPLSTPDDATATHILVFPTSASIQPPHSSVDDPLGSSGLDDDLLSQFPLDDGIEALGGEGENMDDLFSAWDEVGGGVGGGPDTLNSGNMMSTSSGHLGGPHAGADANQVNQLTSDETAQLLQQPLALGYLISTAKVGSMPNWFWSTCPQVKNSCPAFLKSALHIHMPCVQLSDDLLHSGTGQSRKSHQLDSNLTTDVLRYVLEGYNALSWLSLNPKTFDRLSCLPVHMQNLLQLYHLLESFS